jgi:hypothetical protein
MNQLAAEIVGSLSCIVFVGLAACIVMFGVKAIRGEWSLRVEKDGELEGLDIFEHGTPAYHIEFGYGSSYTTPTGVSVLGGGLGKPASIAVHETEPEKV